MKKIKIWFYAVMTIIGVFSFYLGGFVLTGENLKSISGLCIGLGSAFFGLGIGNIIGSIIISKTESEETLRFQKIQENDERNIRIREKVGAKISQIINYMLCAIVFALGFMHADIIIIVMLCSVLLLELVFAIVFSIYYSKIM